MSKLTFDDWESGYAKWREAKRFDIEQYDGEFATMQEDMDGDYVLAADYDQLRKQLDEARGLLQMVIEAGGFLELHQIDCIDELLERNK